MGNSESKFFVGQIIDHKVFGYRGVITGVDATFSSTEAWYEQVAKSRPPKDQPWYHVLVHQAYHMTYVAERNLVEAPEKTEVDHPLITQLFEGFENDRYVQKMH